VPTSRFPGVRTTVGTWPEYDSAVAAELDGAA
jgi:hypothetical protein